MNKKNILIIGNGFVGYNLYSHYKKQYKTTITDRKTLDVTSDKSINNYFLNNDTFTHIIYCVGLKDIKACETDPDLAFQINAEGIKNISKYITKEKFIYISTDYVFDGKAGNYSETDSTNPLTIYGKSKLLGEEYTISLINHPIIVRTSGIYGANCKWVEWLLNSTDEVVCFTDVYNSPTYVKDLAQMIIDVDNQNYSGIINLSGPTSVNRYELYSHVVKNNNLPITLTKGTSNNIFPKDISLNTSLYQKICNKRPKSIEEGFKDLFNEN